MYLGCNSAFAADTGLTTPGDVVGKTDWDMPWKDQAEAYRADDGLVIKNGTPKLNYEEPQTTPEGRTSWLRTSKIPLYDIDGNAFAVLGMYEDITERKQAEENVRTSREQLLNIIDFLPDATLVTDKDRKVVAWNRALEEMTGIKSEEIVGKGDYAYAVPFYGDARPMLVDFAMEHTQVADRYEGIQQQGDRLSAEIYVSSVYQGRGGYLLAIASPLYDANGNIIGAIEAIRDVTERKELELQVQEAFERRGLQVQLSTQISQSIASAASLEDLYERVVTQVKDQFGYYHTQLLRYDEAQEAVVLITGYGETGAKMLAAGHRMPMGEGLIGTAASTGETILRPDLANDPDWHPNPLLPETKGEIAVPIKLGNDILGVLDVQSSAAGALGADDQLLLEGLCGQIATAIESTRLRQEMAERLEEVNRLYRAMSHEGWQTYRETTDIPSSFVYDQAGLRPAKDIDLAEELFANVPLAIPGGEVIGTLAVADDPQRPITPEDETFLQQVSEQLALALESARLFEQTQTALVSVRESQAALDEAMNVANMTNWEYDLATHELTVGERLFTMLGTTVEEFRDSELTATQYIQKFEHPEDRGVVERSLQDAAQSLDPKNFLGHVEFRIVHKDGQTRYMSSSYRVRTDEQGTPLTAIGSWLDITERKKAELAIQESRAALEEAMTVAGMANWELSFETLKFTFNDRIFQMLGTTAEEDGYEIPAEEYAKKYIHPEDAPLIFGAIQEGIQSPDPQNFKGSLEYRMIRKDGAIRYMLTDYRLVVNKQGQAIGGVGSFLDITERKLAELAVAKRAAELATVAQVGTTTAATLEPDRLLQSVVDLAKEQFGLYHAHIYTYEESWSTLLLAAGAGEVGRKLVAEEHAIPMSLEQSLVARAAREQKAVIVNDVNSEPGFLPNPLLPETCAEMAVPMT
ncbi:MAG TPA: PAS domain S-box protein, partial [Anaerolineales bacterium]|nr:PAS domain S-box protein [Anaerolineales bacterium]